MDRVFAVAGSRLRGLGRAADRDLPIDPAEQPALAFGITVGGTYSELDMPLDGAGGPDVFSIALHEIGPCERGVDFHVRGARLALKKNIDPYRFALYISYAVAAS